MEPSLFNAGIDLQAEAITAYLNGGKTPGALRRDGHIATWFHEAPYGIYRTSDGRHIALSLNALDRLDEAIGPSEILPQDGTNDPIDGFRERDKLAAEGARRLAKLTLAEAEQALGSRNLWYAPVQNYSDLAGDPQAAHNRVFETIRVSGKDAVLVNHPNRYNGRVPTIRHIAERAGEDTSALLAEIGLAEAEIAA